MEHSLSPKLERLDALVGEWTMETVFPGAPPSDLRGKTAFQWGPSRAFLIQRWEVPHPAAPDGVAIVAADEQSGDLIQHYFDSRGVVRDYAMSVEDGVWALQRLVPGFYQRFSGRFDAAGDRIDGAWEMSDDGAEWRLDFDLIYTRVG
jgi:hypothetical protein